MELYFLREDESFDMKPDYSLISIYFHIIDLISSFELSSISTLKKFDHLIGFYTN